jgi:phosphinothricin acetyltransferase
VIVRPAEPRDLAGVAAIYNEGIDGRQATFETGHRTGDDLAPLLGARHLLLVSEHDGEVTGWATLSPYSDRQAYAGVAEFAVYVASAARGSGVGRALMDDLARRAGERGVHKLVGKVLSTNEASLGLLRECGFREVGVHRRHGQLDGTWRDVTLVELLL